MNTNYSTQKQEIKTFIMNTDVFSVDDEDNIVNDKGEIVTEMMEVLREIDQYNSNYSERLDELKSDDELSSDAMSDILIRQFPGIQKYKIFEDCADKTFIGMGRGDPIHS